MPPGYYCKRDLFEGQCKWKLEGGKWQGAGDSRKEGNSEELKRGVTLAEAGTANGAVRVIGG